MGSRTAVSSSNNGGRNAASSQYEGALVRQNSLYNLTLEEVQNHLGDGGKQLSSMNMDELLKNILNTDDGGAAHAQSMSMLMNGNGNGNGNGNDNSNGSQMLPSNNALQRQGSITLSRTLSRKSVEEVWRDIQEGQGQGKENEEKKSSHQQQHQRQQTFGEMTLEDFLAKAGVGIARDDNGNANNNTSSSPSNVNVGIQDAAAAHTVSMIQPAPMDVMNIHHHQPQPQPEWFPYQFNNSQSMMMASYGPKRGGVPTGNPILDAGYNDNQLTLSSPLVPCTSSDSTTPGRKRGAPESIIEKTVERRQKRMIKNRESAARSRARKQAYTNELENEVMQLKEENERLKKQQALEKLLPSVPPPQPKHTLRRTTSAFF